MDDNGERLVIFDYCKTCVHYELDVSEEPCYTCLENPVNYYSVRPVNYEEVKG